MPKTRNTIPKNIRDSVLKEFNHRCAICGENNPQLHHIDENPANNDINNLIPLCPNCHLSGQHDISNTVSPEKLRFFRRYKHPLILKPQFNSIFNRMTFLYEIEDDTNTESLEENAEQLIALVNQLSMGSFYANELSKLIKMRHGAFVWFPGDPASDALLKSTRQEDARQYRNQLRNSRQKVEQLIVELLDHQSWK